MALQRPVSILVLTIVLTIPLIFGAVHPIMQGIYAFFMLVGCGGWLLLVTDPDEITLPSFWLLIPLIQIGYIMLQSLPLPLELVGYLSPARADRISMVNELAGTDVAWITISEGGSTGLYRSYFLIGLLLYFLTLLKLCNSNPRFLKTLIICLVAVGTCEAVYGILQFVKPQLGILWLKVTAGRAAYGTIIYKNQYASMLNMLWPLAITGGALYLIGGRKKLRSGGTVFSATKTQAPLLLFAAALMIVAVLFSLSRGGILSMACVGLLLMLLLPFSSRAKFRFLLPFGLLVFGYIMLLGLDTIIARFDAISTSGETRLDVYRYSIPMLLDHWLSGIGLGSYHLLSAIYLKGFPASTHFYRAHNEYLELTIELGVVFGGLLFVWIAAGMLKLGLRLIGSSKNHTPDVAMIALGVAAFCGLCGFLLHGLVDFGWRLPVNLVYAVSLLAIVLTCLNRASGQQPDTDASNAADAACSRSNMARITPETVKTTRSLNEL